MLLLLNLRWCSPADRENLVFSEPSKHSREISDSGHLNPLRQFSSRCSASARAAERNSNRESRDNGPRERRSSEGMATYRLLVGKHHNVGPGSIVGAIANEGGLRRADFGNISILGDQSLVELPEDLPQSVFDKLKSTCISGQLIHIALDDGPPVERRERSSRKSDSKPNSGDKSRKPRHR